MYNYADAGLREKRLLKILLLALSLLIGEPAVAGSKSKDRYVAKTGKGVKYKKKKRHHIKYPYRANININADRIKMRELLKDIYE